MVTKANKVTIRRYDDSLPQDAIVQATSIMSPSGGSGFIDCVQRG